MIAISGRFCSPEGVNVQSVLISQFVLPTLFLHFYFTGINFRGMLNHVCDVAYDQNRCRPIRNSKCMGTNSYLSYYCTRVPYSGIFYLVLFVTFVIYIIIIIIIVIIFIIIIIVITVITITFMLSLFIPS